MSTPLRHQWVRRLAALVLGAVLAALLAEGGLRLHAAVLLDGASDRGGMDGQLTEHHPTLGWLGLPGADVRHRTTEFDVRYRIGEDGFRRLPDDVTAPRPDRPRLTLLGDSFLFGQGVAEDQRVAVQLSRLLDVEVGERALPATGTGQQLLFYEQPGRHRGADWVVLGFLPEHVERLAAERWAGRAKPRFRLEGFASAGPARNGRPPALPLTLDNVPVPADVLPPDERAAPTDPGALALPGKRWLQRHSLLYALLRRELRQPLRQLLGREPEDPHPGLAPGQEATVVLARLIGRLAAAVRADGGRLVVAFLPERWHVAHPRDRRHQDLLAALADHAGAAFVDLGQSPGPQPPEGPTAAADTSGPAGDGRRPLVLPVHPVDGHWTAEGHRLAAQVLARALLDLGLPPPAR